MRKSIFDINKILTFVYWYRRQINGTTVKAYFLSSHLFLKFDIYKCGWVSPTVRTERAFMFVYHSYFLLCFILLFGSLTVNSASVLFHAGETGIHKHLIIGLIFLLEFHNPILEVSVINLVNHVLESAFWVRRGGQLEHFVKSRLHIYSARQFLRYIWFLHHI